MNDSMTSLKPFALGHGGAETIQSSVGYVEQNLLRITYLVKGDIRTLKIPEKCSSHRVDRLWEHTCFEAFIGMKDGGAYYEFNFSPSRQWAAYRFRAYRDGGPLNAEAVAPDIFVEQAADRLRLAATVRLDRLLVIQPGTSLRIGLAAVIEAADGSLSYWALNHPADKPDFHHPDSFALELALPGERA